MLFRWRLRSRARGTACTRLWILALAAATAGCGPLPTSPSHYAPFSQTDLVLGTGDEAVNGATLGVDYTLWLYDASATDGKGLEIESTAGGDPLSFVLGNGLVLAQFADVDGSRAAANSGQIFCVDSINFVTFNQFFELRELFTIERLATPLSCDVDVFNWPIP
jgi:hypothetical protein